jgi:hypothetical protein
MSTVQNVGLGSPSVTYPEPRAIQGQSPASTREEQPRSSTADQVRIQASEARDANRARTEEAKDKVDAKEAAQYASKVGLVDGTLDAFVDIVDPRFQTRIARVFGPSEAAPAIAEAPAPVAIRKAYESVSGAAPGTYRQSA